MLQQRRDDMFQVFVSNLQNVYQKDGRIRLNRKAQQQGPPGGGSQS
jgi:hypothetical protein